MQVEKSIPMPATFPFKEMDVGDSFLVPNGIQRATVSNAARRFSNLNGMKFTVRLISKDKLRCWRVE